MPKTPMQKRIPKLRVSKFPNAVGVPKGGVNQLAKRLSKEVSAGDSIANIFPDAVAKGGILTPSGIRQAHHEQAMIDRGHQRRINAETKPMNVFESLRSAWATPRRGGGIGWARLGKKTRMRPKQVVPRNLVAKGIGIAFRASDGRPLHKTGDYTVDTIAEISRRMLWDSSKGNPVKQQMTKEQLMRKIIAQLEYMNYNMGPSKK